MTINVNCPPRGLFIGRETENVARTLDVDFSAWAAEHGPGTLQVLLQRPGDTAPYPVTLTVDGTVATWKPSETDLAEAGTGAVQLVYTTAAGVREKTQIIPVMVEPSLGVESDPPEGWTSWLDQLTDLAAETEQHAASAAESAENAGDSATDAQRYATDAGDAKNAAVAAAEAAAASASHYPQIVNGVWYVWSPSAGAYISTGIHAQGEDGVSPTVEITAIHGGHRVVITDAEGSHTFDVMDGVTPDLSAYRTAEEQDEIDDAQDKELNNLKSALNHTIIDMGASIVNSNTVGRYNTRVDIMWFDAVINNSYEVDVSIDSAASADIYFYVKDENNVTVVQVRMPTGNTSKTMTFTAASSGHYAITALAMTTMTKTATATIINKSGFIQTVNSDVINVYGTGLIYPVTVSGSNFVVQIAENAVINYKLRNGTFKSKAISANTTYTIAPQNALIIDSSDNTIKQIGRSNIKPSHVVLLATGAYVTGYTRYFEGYFVDRVTVQTTYEDLLLHNVSKDYVRNVDDVITDIVNDNPCDFSAIIGTDIHIPSPTAYSTSRPILNVINRVQTRICADAVLNLGDNIDMGRENPAQAYYSSQQATGDIDDYTNAYFVVGNHDYNNISDVSVYRQKAEWIIPDDAIYRMYGRMHENDVVWGSKEKVYYYKDFTDKKIRMIVLNTLDKPTESVTIDGIEYEKYPWIPNIVSANQVDWFIDEALDFSDKSDKASWAVIILSHCTPAPNVEWNAASLGALNNANPQGIEIIKIAEAFITGTSKALSYTDTIFGGSATFNRSVDFTSQGAIPIIGWFSGHSHIDTKTTINGVTYVTTVAGYPDASIGTSQSMSGMKMIAETYSGFGVDVVSVDKTNRKVKMHRIGIGSDRDWTY